MSTVDFRVIFQSHVAAADICGEQFRQLPQHGIVSLAGLGYVGRREQPPSQAIVIQLLLIVLLDQLEFVGRKESLQGIVAGQVFVRNLFVVDGVPSDEFFIGLEEVRRLDVAIMPDQHCPATWLQDTCELPASLRGPKPVKGLAGHNEIDTTRLQIRGLSAAIYRFEIGPPRKISFACHSHFQVGFDPNNAVPIVEEDLGQHARAASDIGNQMLGPQPAGFLYCMYHIVGVMRSITGVVLGPIGKSLEGIPVCFSHVWENDIVARQMTRPSSDKKPMVSAMTAAIRNVPRGRVSTYGAIAKAAGYPRCARQVARVLRLVGGLPWQRIMGSGGRISLRGESALEQRFRLEAEGVRFKGKRVNMKEFEYKFPDPGRKPAKRSAKRRELPRK